MEINYTLSQQDYYEVCMHKLEPQFKKIPRLSLFTALCIFGIDMGIFILSFEGLNRMNILISVLSSILGFVLIWFLLNFKYKRAAQKYATRVTPNTEPSQKGLILGEDFIQFLGDMEIKSEYAKIRSVELTEKHLYIDVAGAILILPVCQVKKEKPEILQILRSKAANAEWKGC